MFRNLRLKLTLLNLAVVGLISLFFVTGVYLLMERSASINSDQLLQLIAADIGGHPADQITEHHGHGRRFTYFYVKADSSGKITETSPDMPLTPEELSMLVRKTLAQFRQRGEIELGDDNHLKYLKMPLTNGQGTSLVFVDAEPENQMLRLLLAALLVTGLGSLALTLFGSLFMADRALVPIKKSWQRQKNFVADASHELRTPLAVMQTNLEIVMGNPLETVESQATWLENILVENKRMAGLVDDLLFLARADSQQALVEMKCFPLHAVLKEAVQTFVPVADGQGIRLEESLESPVDYFGDQSRIKQLAVILLDNAIKYTPSGGQVALSLKDLGNTVEISVSDTGEGIEKEHLGKIFERFFRVDKARSRQGGGTGLGLAIAEWIVKEHRGEIRVSSIPGKGTTFQVVLPKKL